MTTIAPENTTTFALGDEVYIDHPNTFGRVYEIIQVKRTKCLVKQKDNPTAGILNASMSLMRKVDSAAPSMPQVQAIPVIDFGVGEVVRLRRPFRRNTTSTLMVVTRVNASTVTLDPLGGPANGTSMRVSHNGVVKVDLNSILA